MPARITRGQQAPSYTPALHEGVDARRLQGLEAGPTERFWVGLSVYEPGGAAQLAPAAQETVYVVLDGELLLTVQDDGLEGAADPSREALNAGDSVHLTRGTIRSVQNRSDAPARLLVIIATPAEETP